LMKTNKILLLISPIFVVLLTLFCDKERTFGQGNVVVNPESFGTPYASLAGSNSISDDGRYVVLTGSANGTSNQTDVLVFDRQNRTIKIASVSSGGEQGNDSSRAAGISGDGRFVVFYSFASNLVSDDTNGFVDAFIHDLETGETKRISLTESGQQITEQTFSDQGQSFLDSNLLNEITPLKACISYHGRFVAFQFDKLTDNDSNKIVRTSLTDVYLLDQITGEINLVSISSDGMQANWDSTCESISSDGRHIVFSSKANNLVENDTNDFIDLFVHDFITKQTIRVSVRSDGTEGDRGALTDSCFGADVDISADGRYVVFSSQSDLLAQPPQSGLSKAYVYDQDTGQTNLVSIRPGFGNGVEEGGFSPSISANGQYVSWVSNGNVYARNVNSPSSQTQLMSKSILIHPTGTTLGVTPMGGGLRRNCRITSMSAGGKVVTYDSDGLIYTGNGYETKFTDDIYVSPIETQTITPTNPISPTICGSLELAQRFAPDMYFHEDEDYEPIAVEIPLQHSNLVYYQEQVINGEKSFKPFQLAPSPSISDLLDPEYNVEIAHIDLKGDDIVQMLDAYTQFNPPPTRQIYASFYCPSMPYSPYPNVNITTVIQYWFFYYDNPWLPFTHHEGDWEMIQIMLDGNNNPIYAAYSQHYSGSWRRWESVKKTGDRPHIYVAEGSHASFFEESNFIGYGWLDDTAPSKYGNIAKNDVTLLPIGEKEWGNFKGHWGGRYYEIGFPESDSPLGPKYRKTECPDGVPRQACLPQVISLWKDPTVWFAALKPDEEAVFNKFGKINVSSSSPLSMTVGLNIVDQRNVSPTKLLESKFSAVEYINNPDTGRRTLIVHELSAEKVYIVRLKADGSELVTSEPITLTVYFSDISTNVMFEAHYQLPSNWNPSSGARLELGKNSDFKIQIDLDGDHLYELSFDPISLERQSYAQQNIYLPLIKR
jgi:hypothetical protein